MWLSQQCPSFSTECQAATRLDPEAEMRINTGIDGQINGADQ
jgi:hypothetical protein